MSLNALSDELLLNIAEFVNANDNRYLYDNEPDRGWRYLAKLALCSRRLNSIATPILYRSFHQTGEIGGEKRLPTLLHLLKRKPELVACIRSLEVSEISEGDDYMNMAGFSRQDIVRCGLGREAVGYMDSAKPNWLKELEAGDWRAVIAFLLLLLPSLEEVRLTCSSKCLGSEIGSEFINEALVYAARQQRKQNAPHSLRNLKTVWMDYWDTEMGMSINVLLPFCALPSVTVARINRANDDDFRFHIMPTTWQYRISDLHITHSNIGPEAIGPILSCFPSLKFFLYGNGGSNVGYEDFLPQYLGRAIAHLNKTLEELTVLDYEKENYGDIAPGPIGELTDFKVLKKVTTYYDCLLRLDPESEETPKLTDVLPSSIEVLALSQCKPDILGQARDVLEQRALGRNFLSLRRISLANFDDNLSRIRAESAETHSIEEKELITQGDATGVTVQIVHPLVSWMGGSDFGEYKEFEWAKF